MQSDLERMSTVWRDQSSAYIEHLTDDILSNAGPSYAKLERDQMLVSSQLVVKAWQTALDSGDSTSIREFAHRIGHRRADSQVSMDDIMQVVNIVREEVWGALRLAYAADDWNIAVVATVESWLHEMRNGVVSSYGETLQEAQRQFAERQEALDAQNQLIRELSTPIMPIHAGVLVLPIVGAVDARRATQILESVLEEIVASQADVLILDITGVPFIDASVANHILQMARAVMLLGAKIVLVGIGAEVAQTLVQLEIDLSSIITKANLAEGIAYALEQMGQSIQTTRNN
jgi:rsbT co-antagonist protein RsbR